MCATNGLCACFREPEMLHLTLLDEFFDGAGGIFDGNIGIDAVLIEQVDDIGLETLERGLGDLPDVFRTTIQRTPTGSTIGIRLEPELGGDHHLVAKRSERIAHKFFIGEWSV